MEKRMSVTIDKQGNVEIDLKEGFQGTSCVAATKFIEVAINAGNSEQKEKDAYYEEADYNTTEIFNIR